MALTRWTPFGDLSRMRDEMDRVFSQFFGPGEGRELAPARMAWAPSVDVYERDNSLVVEAELPGVKKEDLELSIEDGTLTIRGEMKEESEKREEGIYRRERRYGQFIRSIPLPVPVKAEEAQARFEDGVLRITLPETGEAKGKKIQIQ